MRKDEVKLSNVNPALPDPIFAGTFENHMRMGDKSGTSHSGLHVITEFTKDDGKTLTDADVVSGRTFRGRLDGRATTVTIRAVDTRAKTFTADVTKYDHPKRSTFFPATTTLAEAKEYIRKAYKDYCVYGTASYGGGAVDIYKQIMNKYGLRWAGMAKMNDQLIWIGCTFTGPIITAFPAVANKFN